MCLTSPAQPTATNHIRSARPDPAQHPPEVLCSHYPQVKSHSSCTECFPPRVIMVIHNRLLCLLFDRGYCSPRSSSSYNVSPPDSNHCSHAHSCCGVDCSSCQTEIIFPNRVAIPVIVMLHRTIFALIRLIRVLLRLPVIPIMFTCL